MAESDELLSTVWDRLDQSGEVDRIKAQIQRAVFATAAPPAPAEGMHPGMRLSLSLVLDWLESLGLDASAAVLKTEAGLTEGDAPLSREMVAHSLGLEGLQHQVDPEAPEPQPRLRPPVLLDAVGYLTQLKEQRLQPQPVGDGMGDSVAGASEAASALPGRRPHGSNSTVGPGHRWGTASRVSVSSPGRAGNGLALSPPLRRPASPSRAAPRPVAVAGGGRVSEADLPGARAGRQAASERLGADEEDGGNEVSLAWQRAMRRYEGRPPASPGNRFVDIVGAR